MKRILAILAALAIAPGLLAAAELVERVVARINDRIITQSEFDQRIARARTEPNAPTGDQLRTAVLEQMIRENLIEDRAKDLDVKVDAEEVQEAINRVKKQYGITSDTDFDQALKSTGMTRADLEKQMRESIITNKVLQREVHVDLSDDALRAEYEKIKEKAYRIPEHAHVFEVYAPYGPGTGQSRAEALQKIDEAASRIAAGQAFENVARDYSQGPGKDKGGDIGVVNKGDLAKELDDAIFGTADLSKPIESRNAFYILKVSDRAPASYKTFNEVKDDLRNRISDEFYSRKLGDYLEDLRHRAYVKIFDPELAKSDQDLLQKAEAARTGAS
jgi:peptidyl-prolyl cis-trans isomerase SurA